MDHKTLCATIAERLNLSKDDTNKLFASLTQCIGETAANLDIVTIPSFGAFEPRKRAERIIAQPSTGKRLLVPPKIVLGLKPSAILKQKIK